MKEHFIQANALHIPLANNSVQCCVTSPPYWGLRDYGTAKWEGGDPECDHKGAKLKSRYDYSLASSPIQDGTRTGTDAPRYKDTCPDCGAVRVDNQLGLEQTPEEYVAHMVEVFREVKRVLKDDGVLWLNLGDSYASDTKSGGRNDTEKMYGENSQHLSKHINIKVNHGLKPKDLVGIPWRVAFALQADGWWLRSDVIWSKPNPMTESVRDRPTKAHEYIFMLTKSARYYFDADAVKEDSVDAESHTGRRLRNAGNMANYDRDNYKFSGSIDDNGKLRSGQTYPKRNIRSVWHVATAPYKGAHFATYPPKLIEPCILAGSKKGDIVFDPFNGSGTTGLVARKHGRNYIGTDLSMEYIHQSQERLSHKALKHWMEGKIVEKTDLGPLFEVTV